MYRINTIHVEVPKLSDREGDVLVLADFFLEKFASKYGKPGLKINSSAQEKLNAYHWPGNIRELQHTIERAVILGEGDTLKPTDFILNISNTAAVQPLGTTLEEMEAIMIRKALDQHQSNYTAVAEQLGISRQTLYNKMKKMNIHGK